MGLLSSFLSTPSLQEWSIGPTGPSELPTAVGPEVNLPSQGAITSGYQLDRTAIGPWPMLMPAEVANKSFTSYVRNGFHDFFKASVGANYGSLGGSINFGFTLPRFRIGAPDTNGQGSIGLYPGPVPNTTRPMYNNLTQGANYLTQVLDALDLNPQAWSQVQTAATTFVVGGTASLGIQAPTLV